MNEPDKKRGSLRHDELDLIFSEWYKSIEHIGESFRCSSYICPNERSHEIWIQINNLDDISYPTISTSLEVIVLLLENVFLLCFQGLSMGLGISLLFKKMNENVLMHHVAIL